MDSLPREPSLVQKASGAFRYLAATLGGYPTLVNLEVTRRCNARCDFCRYWTMPSEPHLDNYVPVLRKLRPSAVVFTGGEPLMRPDLERLISDVRHAFPVMYLGMVTNGGLLTVERGMKLWNAGLTVMTVSLDFPDERHDTARGVPGLAARIRGTVPKLVASGVSDLVVQVVIKSDNIDCVREVVAWATSVGARVSLAAYTAMKNGNDAHTVDPSQKQKLCRLVDEMVKLKHAGGAITSSTYYLEHIPPYCQHGGIGGCLSGRRFVTVMPNGHVLRCSESTDGCDYTEWTPGRFGPTNCGACWVPCRGETQAPITWERLRQIGALYRGGSRSPASATADGGQSPAEVCPRGSPCRRL